MSLLGLLFVVAGVHGTASPPVACGDYKAANDLSNETAAIEACISTRWCVWDTLAAAPNNCILDLTLKYIPEPAPQNPCVAGTLYYITDEPNCTNVDGLPKTQHDLFCREGTPRYLKKAVDACFFQDLKARYEDPSANPPIVGQKKCDNVAGLVCAWGKESAQDYCYDTATPQAITNLNQDSPDLFGYCAALGEKYCNLYPNCTKSKGNGCVPDPCSQGTPGNVLGASCTQNVPASASGHCITALIQTVNDAGTSLGATLPANGFCISKENWGDVKKNEYNSCYFAYKGRMTLVAPNVYNGDDKCKEPVGVDKCGGGESDAIVYKFPTSDGQDPESGKSCQLVSDLQEGYLSTGSFCWDGVVAYPQVSSAFAVQVPGVLLLIAALLSLLI